MSSSLRGVEIATGHPVDRRTADALLIVRGRILHLWRQIGVDDEQDIDCAGFVLRRLFARLVMRGQIAGAAAVAFHAAGDNRRHVQFPEASAGDRYVRHVRRRSHAGHGVRVGHLVASCNVSMKVVPLLDATVFKFLEVVFGTVLGFLGAEEVRDRVVDHGFVHGLGNDIVGVGRVFYVPYRGDGAVDDGNHVPVLPDEVFAARAVVLGALAVERVCAFGEGREVGCP